MSNFGTMKRRIETEMVRGDISNSSTVVNNAVIDAIKHFQVRPTWFNEFNNSAHVTTASSEWVTLSASVGEVQLYSVKIRISGTRDYPLSEDGYQAIDRIDSAQYTGYPEVYSYFGKKLRLYPIPDAEYTLLMSGVAVLPEISIAAASTATNAWMTFGEEPIRLRAKGNLFRDYVRNIQAAEVFYTDAEKQWDEQIAKRTRRLHSTRRVRRYQW